MAGQARPECDRGKQPDPKPASGRRRRAQLVHGTRHPASGAASSAGPRGSRAPRRPLSVSPGSRVNKGACPRGATPVPLSPPVPRPAIPAITTHCHWRPRQTGIRSSALRRAGGDRKMRGGKKKGTTAKHWYDQLLSDSENNPRLSVSLIRRPRENGGINVRVAAGRSWAQPTPTGDSSGGRGHPRTAGHSTVPTPRAAADGFTEEGDSVTGRFSSPAQDPRRKNRHLTTRGWEAPGRRTSEQRLQKILCSAQGK